MATKDLSANVQQAKLRLGIIGNTPELTQAVARAIMAAPIDLSVLITGESGTGKEFFPQIIHQYSARKHSKYIAVNCGAIPKGTVESELFGHVKGAFTGASETRKGYFEEANGGTIFLDEVGELPIETQAKLLRVLEKGEFMKVGSSEVQKTNIRVVAATNVDMQKAVAEGKFREDLYYRLSTVQIAIPPLRDRGKDIERLAMKFAADFAEKYRMPQVAFADDAKRMLLSYGWPGNVRQLKNVVEQTALFEAGTEVGAETLRQYLPDARAISNDKPALRTHSYEAERDMLFNIIFSLRGEIDKLKEQIAELGTDNAPVQKEPYPHALANKEAYPGSLPINHSLAVQKYQESAPKEPSVMDVVARDVNAPQPTSLAENEREMIKQSLERNNGQRKKAAQELQISERTLYRKIKEYGLD